jgi:hypothetical protein
MVRKPLEWDQNLKVERWAVVKKGYWKVGEHWDLLVGLEDLDLPEKISDLNSGYRGWSQDFDWGESSRCLGHYFEYN